MELNRLVGHILISLVVWAMLIVIWRIKDGEYRSLYSELIGSKEITKWQDAYLYYYKYARNYLRIVLLSVSIFALAYYSPIILPSLFGIEEMPGGLLTVRKYAQVVTIMVSYIGLVSYHRCHYQVEGIYKAFAK